MLWIVLKCSSLCLLVCATVFLYIYVQNIFSYWKKRNISYVQPYFPLGNINFIMRKCLWNFLYDIKMKHPNDEYVGIYLGLKPVLVVQTPELARQILIKDFEYFQNRFMYVNESDPYGSLNLFALKNPMWKEMRHELTPLFTGLRIKKITVLVNQNGTDLVKKIQRDFIDNEKTLDLMELLTMYTTDTIAHSVFGIRSSILNGEDSPLWTITQHFATWTFRRGLEFSLFFLLPAIANLFRLKIFTDSGTKYIKNLFWTVVRERQYTRTTNDQDLVNHLLKLKQNFKLPSSAGPEVADQLMLAQTCLFIMASIEACAITMSFCLHELAYHPEVQEKLYEEISKASKDSGKDILQYEELMKLKYMTACVYETLRKYPNVPYIDRICNKEYKLNDDVTIEEGVPVFVNIAAIHHDEKYYPSPAEWRPERFMDIEKDKRIFLTFGDGPRSCIGKTFGMMQIQVALAQLITTFRFEPAAPYDIPMDPYCVFMAPKGGDVVKFVRR